MLVKKADNLTPIYNNNYKVAKILMFPVIPENVPVMPKIIIELKDYLITLILEKLKIPQIC